ncbi:MULTISPECIES: PadR family transcriptional regulator [unclassified Pantoea]|jgi:DNA-binding PadR family transcriptional regulator|uniref:PadR family transcriptional regulator n=1 Tax=unclassified Pantoea TaxID=2630326 RepID=UPI0012AD72AB|nr:MULTISPECIES: PadR family transcriptional regulator [unclassified Pantoea]MEA5104912.1 PadR family transcriptional regulator [Pantoea sp. S18]MRT41538.1 PadR family transcriptional regulator [Enterobacteriaceae bacterium RIT702]UVC28688.1 PadR family transcriptional regulator [Pantoea sp. SOD02]
MKQQRDFPWQSDHAQRTVCAGARKKRRERMLDASDIRLLMLHFLANSSAHGYELIKSVEELSKGEYSPSPGIIYPNLTLLEEMDAIRVVDAQASRKAYALNESGVALLAENRDNVDAIIERLTSLAILVNNRSIPQVEQAIHLIKHTLNHRLAQEDISAESLEIVIEALHQAAEKIANS